MKYLDESWSETLLRWHLYRRISRRPGPAAALRFRRAVRQAPVGPLALDCGANVGDVSLYLARQGMHVIAFEPDPLARTELLRRTDGHPSITVEASAVGAANGIMPLYQEKTVSGENMGETIGSSLAYRDGYHRPQPMGNVPVINIARYINGLPQMPWIVKLDIEGSEVEVLDAILDAGLHRHIHLIVAETHDRFSPELARDTDELRKRLARESIRNIDLGWV